MRNIKLVLAYDGTNYSGFQIQPKRPTIQGELEKALSTLLREKVKIIGAARTDAGVHAKGQVVNFFTRSSYSLSRISRSLNALLPLDIKVLGIEEVDISFHARKSAVSKCYRYHILNRPYPSPFLFRYSHLVTTPLDLGRMEKGAKYLLGKHDFTSFCAKPHFYKNRVRTVSRIGIKKCDELEEGLTCIEIEADGFLYNMVRIIVGTLIQVGLGKIPPENVKKILAAKDRKKAGPTAPAQGLFLFKVKYG